MKFPFLEKLALALWVVHSLDVHSAESSWPFVTLTRRSSPNPFIGRRSSRMSRTEEAGISRQLRGCHLYMRLLPSSGYLSH